MSNEQLQDGVIVGEEEQAVDDKPAENARVDFNEEQQKRFNEVYWRANQAEREAQELKQRLESLQNAKEEPKKVDVVSYPDDDLKYEDPDAFAKQRQAWEAQIKESARQEALNALRAESQRAEEVRQQEALNGVVKGYQEKAVNSGLNAEKLVEAEKIIAAYNPSKSVANFIMKHDNAPHIVNYLAENQQELAELSKMDDMSAAIALSAIGSKVSSKTVTSAPDPVDSLKGDGFTDEDPALKGATFY